MSSPWDSRTSRSASSPSDSKVAPVGRDDPVAQGLEVPLQVGERRPELVGRVGDELAAHTLLLLEGGGHLVERIREAHDLLGALPGDPRLVAALGDPARGRADLP
jgi:hypothetical protein